MYITFQMEIEKTKLFDSIILNWKLNKSDKMRKSYLENNTKWLKPNIWKCLQCDIIGVYSTESWNLETVCSQNCWNHTCKHFCNMISLASTPVKLKMSDKMMEYKLCKLLRALTQAPDKFCPHKTFSTNQQQNFIHFLLIKAILLYAFPPVPMRIG